MAVPFANAVLGAPILVYMDAAGRVVFTPTDQTILAMVSSLYGNDNGRPTAVLIAWKDSDKRPTNLEYRGGINEMAWQAWDNGQNIYRFIPAEAMNEYKYGLWVRDVSAHPGLVFSAFQDDTFGTGPVVPGFCGSLLYIKASEISPGDMIAWITDAKKLNYGTVRETSEGESPIGEPVVVLDADVYCEEGERKFPNGYPMPPDFKVLLISRSKQ
jgi:hypothetical protein